MNELIRHIINKLVDNPDKVKVEEKEEGDRLVYYITVETMDRGRVIGREGRTIKAIRMLVSAASSKSGKKFVVRIVD